MQKQKKKNRAEKNYKRSQQNTYIRLGVFLVYRQFTEVRSLENMADFGVEFGVEEVVFRIGCTERVSQEGLGGWTVRGITRNRLARERRSWRE